VLVEQSAVVLDMMGILVEILHSRILLEAGRSTLLQHPAASRGVTPPLQLLPLLVLLVLQMKESLYLVVMVGKKVSRTGVLVFGVAVDKERFLVFK
jgi:hypothetical protein